jgi:HSP20 family molecular chaperone IbpA
MLQEVHGEIRRRAYEIFVSGGMCLGNDLHDWLAAEAEMTWKPSIELFEIEDGVVVRAALPGINPKDVDVHVTPESLLIHAEKKHEHDHQKGAVRICDFPSGRLFRAVDFPVRIDPDKIQGEFSNGVLTLTVRKTAATEQVQKMEKQLPAQPRTAKKARA